MLASRMTDAVSPAALLPFPDVYTAIGACHVTGHSLQTDTVQCCRRCGCAPRCVHGSSEVICLTGTSSCRDGGWVRAMLAL